MHEKIKIDNTKKNALLVQQGTCAIYIHCSMNSETFTQNMQKSTTQLSEYLIIFRPFLSQNI